MDNINLEKIKAAGVVGAGGAGFPTHVKINNKATIVIANGAECEPLLRVDHRIMEYYPEKVVQGMQIVMGICGAEKGVICLKEKYQFAVERLKKAVKNYRKLSLHLLENYYPAGDEQQLVYEVTGKTVPPGGLPISAGAVVLNVGTLMNIAEAIKDMPVTCKLVTVTGDVKNPVTVNAPIGTPLKDLVAFAGGPEDTGSHTMIVGGPVMGRIERDWSQVVTKTTGGIVILPSDHKFIERKAASLETDYRLAKSVCCQCNYCTQLCPRNLLGLGVEPHKAMRSIVHADAPSLQNVNTVFSCCDCGICTYYACDMGLSPNKIVTAIKQSMARKGLRPDPSQLGEVSAQRDFAKVPAHRFIERLGLVKYDLDAPLAAEKLKVSRVRIPLKQHIGTPARPQVAEGEQVIQGQLIGSPEEGKLGANIHASIDGVVARLNEEFIEIKAE